MNNNFSFKRFGLLVRYQGIENYKSYFMLWALTSLFILLILATNTGSDISGVYIGIFCFMGCLVATTSTVRWTNTGSSSFFLLIPANITEKFLCSLFYCIVLYIPTYLLSYLFSKYILFSLLSFLLSHNHVWISFKDSTNETSSNYFWYYLTAFMSLLCFQSIFLIVALSYKKRQFLIALLITIFVYSIYFYTADSLMPLLTGIPKGKVSSSGVMPYMIPEFWFISFSGSATRYELFHFIKTFRNIFNLVWFFIFGLLYIAAWFRLKEREI
jgi:hypothetical protein